MKTTIADKTGILSGRIFDPDWEVISESRLSETSRLKVQNGWIVRHTQWSVKKPERITMFGQPVTPDTNQTVASCAVFVPDIRHFWRLKHKKRSSRATNTEQENATPTLATEEEMQ